MAAREAWHWWAKATLAATLLHNLEELLTARDRLTAVLLVAPATSGLLREMRRIGVRESRLRACAGGGVALMARGLPALLAVADRVVRSSDRHRA